MGELGRYLHDLRAQRGMTLEEVSRVTRIGKRHLGRPRGRGVRGAAGPRLRQGVSPLVLRGAPRAPGAGAGALRGDADRPPGRRPRRRAARSRARAAVALWWPPRCLLIALAGGLAALQLATRRGAGPGPPPAGWPAPPAEAARWSSPSTGAPGGAGLPGGTDAPTSAAPCRAPAAATGGRARSRGRAGRARAGPASRRSRDRADLAAGADGQRRGGAGAAPGRRHAASGWPSGASCSPSATPAGSSSR